MTVWKRGSRASVGASEDNSRNGYSAASTAATSRAGSFCWAVSLDMRLLHPFQSGIGQWPEDFRRIAAQLQTDEARRRARHQNIHRGQTNFRWRALEQRTIVGANSVKCHNLPAHIA